MTDWLENLKRYALSDDIDYLLTWEDAAIALEEIERLREALERIACFHHEPNKASEYLQGIAREALRDD